MQRVGVIFEAAASAEFLAGLRWGGFAAGIAAAVAIAWRGWRRTPAPVAGLAAVTAAAIAMPAVRPLSPGVWAGLALLIGAGAVFPLTSRSPVLAGLAALPGAGLIGFSNLPGPAWVVVVVVLVTTVGGPLLSGFDDRANPSPVPMVLFTISAAGVWATVPDTEEALVLLGALAAPTLLAWPLRLARLGPVGGHALVGLFTWVVAWGGRGREGSIVGAAAALGMLLVAPMGAGLRRRLRVATDGWSGLGLVGLQLALVAVTTRVAGLLDDAAAAAAIAVPALLAGLLVWIAVEGAAGRRSAAGSPIQPGSG